MENEATGDELLRASDVMARYKISDMTLWRWENDPALNFPKPMKIRKRRFWRLGDLTTFDARQRAESETACAAS